MAEETQYVPKEFSEFSLDYYSDEVIREYDISPKKQMEMVYEASVNYARKFPVTKFKSLLMDGGTGLGKTMLATGIAKTAAKKGCSVQQLSAPEFFDQFNYQRVGAVASALHEERVKSCDLLVLDALGMESESSFTTPFLYKVIDYRLTKQKPTIITTNLNMKGIVQKYGPQIASRLMGEYINLVFLGEDIRVRKALDME